MIVKLPITKTLVEGAARRSFLPRHLGTDYAQFEKLLPVAIANALGGERAG